VCSAFARALLKNLSIPDSKSGGILFSLHFNGHFPGGPELAGTRMSAFWISLELRMMEVVVTTGAIRRAKLQLKRHHQQTNTQFFTGSPSCRSTNSVRVLKEKVCITFHGLHHHKLRLPKAPSYLRGRLPSRSLAL